MKITCKRFYSKEGIKNLYRLCGIYFLVHDSKIDYIGRSVNIGNRLMSHHVFDRNYHEEIWVYEVPFGQAWNLKKIELQLIREHHPERNINGTIKQSIMQTGKRLIHHD